MQSSSGGDNDFGSLQQFLNPSLVSHHQHHPHSLLAQGLDQVPFPSSSSMQPRPVGELNGVVKNPKKRTRASRKAPTTVLTTDPTNFRAMVQEYTGIPTPPGSSSFSRKLDIFGSGSSGTRSSTHLEPLRPSAKRVQPAATSLLNNIPLAEASNMLNFQAQILQPPLQPSLNLPGCPASASSTMASLDGTRSSTHLEPLRPSAKRVQPAATSLLNNIPLAEASNMLNFQAQILQPPLQPSLNLPGCPASASSTMASLDGVSGNLGGLHGNWRGAVGLNNGNQDQFRPFDGVYSNTSQRLNSFKSNYSSLSDFQHEKGLENVSSRAQGTVDSWISPAD
ncbi:hypothetical protein GOBAR_AA10765 [Gossypium barbadense]|uniref:VQ domain-containing protein n=1 Tax=Gossypium barbadense TaxID=3634 RepID=A0A2P5Y2V0_GOSBA|nr:hypothetical protein GOBAR_AA10765 [Gossypium barbadense]